MKDLAGFDQDSWKLIVGVRAVPQGINAVSDLTVGTINSVPDSVDAITDFGIQSGNKWISKLPSPSGGDRFCLLANCFPTLLVDKIQDRDRVPAHVGRATYM